MSREKGRIPVYLNFVVERRDSQFVPWEMIEDESYTMKQEHANYPLQEDMGLFDTDVWPVPVENPIVGEQYHIEGKAEIVHTQSWTDCGWEWDAYIEWEEPLKVERLNEQEEV